MTTRDSSGGLHEQTANIIIAEWLNDAGGKWRADGERTRTIQNSNGRPDILITEGDRMPVIVESEYDDKPNPGGEDAKIEIKKCARHAIVEPVLEIAPFRDTNSPDHRERLG